MTLSLAKMKPFQHVAPAFRTFVGDGCLTALGGELRRESADRIVVFCGRSIASNREAIGRVEQALGSAMVDRFNGVRAHSPVPVVVEAARVLESARANGVVAVGGGSAVVTARAASILLAEGPDVRRLCTRRDADGHLSSPKLLRPKIPQWVVATTPTTAYAKAGSALFAPDTGERLALFDPRTRAKGLFIDPAMAATAPKSLFESAGLNALAMAVEGLEADVDNPLSESQLRHAITMLAGLLPRIRNSSDDADLRERLMLAALLCGQGTDSAGGGLTSVLSHSLGPRSDASNGVLGAIVLPHVMRFNAPVTGARLQRVGAALDAVPGVIGSSRGTTTAVIQGIESLMSLLNTPTRLRDVGIDRSALEAAADHAMQDWFLQRNPRPVDRSQVIEILHAAW